jgi:spore germination protein KC
MKVFKVWFTSFFSCFILTGCWDMKEVNDIAFVLATGIDKESNKYRVTLQIALPGQLGQAGSTGGSGGASGGNKSGLVTSATGNSIREANEKQQLALSRQLNFSHRRVILIGENMAKAGIKPLVAMLSSVPQNRLSSYVFIVKNSAKNVISSQTKLEKLPAEKIRKTAEIWLKAPPDVKKVADVLQSRGIDLALPLVSLAESRVSSAGKANEIIVIEGLAAFHNDKLVGFLKADQAKGALLAMNKANHPTITFRLPSSSGNITMQLRSHHTELKPIIQNKQVSLELHFYADAYLFGNESNVDLAAESFFLNVEKAANQEAKQEIEAGIHILQRKFHSDALGLGDSLFRDHPKEWNYLAPNWEELYPKISLQVHPHIHIDQTGIVSTPIGPKEEELKK